MNKDKLLSEPDISKEEVLALEKVTKEINTKIQRLILEVARENPNNLRHAINACIYGPITFAFNAMDTFNEVGIKPNERYPTFVKVYANYAKSLGKLENEWLTLSFDQFQEKFAEFYTADTHFVWDMDK